LREMRKNLSRLRVTSYRNRALTDHPAHREMKKLSNKYGEAILQAKKQHWSSYLEDMSANEIWTANKYIRDPVGDGGSPRIPTLRTHNAEGEAVEINNNEDKAKLFARTFFPPPPPRSTVPEGFVYPEPLPDPPQITKAQIERQICRLSPYKAYGLDEIANVVLQKCLDLLIAYLLFIFRAVLSLGTYYAPWRDFTTVVLRKPGKPSYETAKAHRPIALLSTVAKVLTAIVAEDISHLVEHHQLLPATHFGGRPGRTTTDAVHYLVQLIKNAWRKGLVASVLFLDVEGAFPNAVTDRLIHNLRRRRIPAVYTTFIQQLLVGRRTKLRFDDFTSDFIDISNGIGQGDPLSMNLYTIYNADLLDIPGNEDKESSLGYVDDIALVAIGEDFHKTTRTLKQMMTKDDGGLQWSKEHNSKFEVSKSVVLHATRKTQQDPEDDNKRIPLERPPLTIEGQRIQEVSSFKYLGVQVDAQLSWKEQAQRAAANATKWILQYRRLTRPTSGVSNKLMRQLYLAVALPKITYGLDIWYSPPIKLPGSTRNTGSVGTLRCLQKIQRTATLAITGTLRTTPTDLLDAHAGVLPMELALSKVCHRAMVRMLTLPDTHPLHQFINEARTRPPLKHQGPVDHLLKAFKLENEDIETIIPAIDDPYRPSRFQTCIQETRELSIEQEDNDAADYRVYSDGSGFEGGIGAAAVLYKKGQARPVNQLKAYLGPMTKHNTYEGEAVGGILALWLIHVTIETVLKTISLYVDNQAFIKASVKPKATPGQYLIRDFADEANAVGPRLSVRWISSHDDVTGNERADKLAKEAAAGRASRRIDLPPLLRRTLPTSASAKNQDHMEHLKKDWNTLWLNSPRRSRINRIDSSFPFSKYRKRQNELSREQASLLMQVRSGHFPLNVFLFRIGKSDTKQCQACQLQPDEEAPPETLNHFLFECEAYTAQRTTLARIIGRENLNLKAIMQHTKSMKALVHYIKKTRRFEN